MGSQPLFHPVTCERNQSWEQDLFLCMLSSQIFRHEEHRSQCCIALYPSVERCQPTIPPQSSFAPLKNFFIPNLPRSFAHLFLVFLPPRGILSLTGGAVKFEWCSSGFDAVTFHPLREFKAIKLLQMRRHRCSEMYQVAKPGASCPWPVRPVLHLVCCN